MNNAEVSRPPSHQVESVLHLYSFYCGLFDLFSMHTFVGVQDDAVKIREAFSILSQGIEITQYNYSMTSLKSFKLHGVLWLDSNMFRICLDTARSTVSERIRGKIPPGIYLRDMCEVRPGFDTVNVKFNRVKPESPDQVLTMIGTENSYTVELPSKV